jgi:putative acetyltransferase
MGSRRPGYACFLEERDILELRPQVRDALSRVENLLGVWDAQERLQAFFGVHERKIEMLFVHSAAHGQGFGRALVEHAIKATGATEVEVNEQNPQAIGFYEHMGFHVHARLPVDGQGRPFPLLVMRLASTAPGAPNE